MTIKYTSGYKIVTDHKYYVTRCERSQLAIGVLFLHQKIS